MKYNHFSELQLVASIRTISIISVCLDENAGIIELHGHELEYNLNYRATVNWFVYITG